MEVANNTILIIEDDAGLIELLDEKIRESGRQTVCMTSATKAFEWLKSNTPFLILLDYSFPEMNAKEFISRLKSESKEVVPFILATGQGDERIAVEMMKLGARDYVVKDSHFLEMIPLVIARVCSEIVNENKLLQTEQALIESTQFSKQIIESAQEGIVVYDLNMNYVTWNPFMEKLTGYHASDLLGKNAKEIFPFLQEAKVLYNIEKALEGIEVPENEFYFDFASTGKSGWLSDSIASLRNVDGKIIGAISTLRDITGRKTAELEVQRIGQHYQAIIEKSPAGFVLLDQEGRFQYASPSALRMFGYDQNELNILHPADITYPDDLDLVLGNLALIIENPTLHPVIEYRFKHKRGEWRWIESTISNLFDDPAVGAIVINFSDVSERKQAQDNLRLSEEKFRSIFENSIVGKSLTTIDGKLSVNKAFTKILGYSAEEFSRISWKDFTYKDDLEYNLKEIELMISGEKDFSHWEKRYIHKSGSIIWVDISTVLLRDNDGEPLHFITEIYDITKRKQAEEDLLLMKQSYFDIFNSVSEAIYVLDENGTFIEVNKGAEDMYLLSHEELIGKTPNAVAAPGLNDMEKIAQQLESVRKTGIPTNFEFWAVRKNGEVFPKDVNVNQGKYFDKNVLLVTARDVTERKQAEEAIRKSEERYRLISDVSSDYVFTSTLDENNNLGLSWVTGAFDRITGYTFDEYLAAGGWRGTLHPDDLELDNNDLEQLKKNQKVVSDIRTYKKNGDCVWVCVYAHPIWDVKENKLIGIYGGVKDITERKNGEMALRKSEELYRNLVLRIPDGVYKSTPEGKFIDVNPAMVTMLGYDSKEELLNIDIKKQLYFDLDDRESETLNEQNEEMAIFQLKRKDGTGIWIEDHGWYNKDNENNITSHEGVLRDITERKNAEIELSKKQTELTELFDEAPVGYHELNSEGKIIRINQTELDLLGFKKEELIGQYIWKLGLNEEETKQIVLEKLAGKIDITPSFERDVMKKDGSVIDFMVQDVYLYDATGKISGIRSTFQDITERKKAEALLKYERELYLDLVNTQPAGIYRIRVVPKEKWDKDAWRNSEKSPYVMELASDRFCEILGLSRAEFKNNTRIISDLIHPNDKDEFIQKNEEANEKQIPFYWDCRLIINDEIKWVHLESIPRRLENGDIIFTGILYDITDRIIAQNALLESETMLKKTLVESTGLIDIASGVIEYEKISDTILEISGAKYVSFNLFEKGEKDFTTVAISGVKENLLKASTYFGFDLLNKKWKFDPIRAEKTKDNTITRFESFFELSSFSIPRKISNLMEKTFNFGEAFVVKITKNNVPVGDFTLIYTKGETLRNSELVSLFASQVALFLDRENANNALRFSEEKYRYLFANNPQPMWIYDLDTLKFIEVNEAAINHYGYTREEFLSMDITQIRPPEEIPALLEDVKFKRMNYTSSGLWKHTKKDGTIIIVDVTTISVIAGGKEARHVMVQDITERINAEDALRESEDKYRTMIENSNDVIWTLDSDGNFQFMNKVGMDATDLKINEWRGKSFVPLVMDEDLPMLLDVFDKTMQGKNCNYELRFKKIDNTVLTFQVNTSPIIVSGKIEGVVSFGRDITDRKFAEQALQDKMDELIRFHNLTVDRELTMIELKREINKLLINAGEHEKYKIHE